MVERCDDVDFEVTLLVPHVYRIRAENEEQAKELAACRWAFAVNANAVGFPIEMTVKQVDSPAAAPVSGS